jgi:uncharacterized protein (DUF1778 family)
VAAQTRNAKNVTLRLYEEEYQALVDACEALSSAETRVEPSVLLATAAMEESSRLGFTPSTGGLGTRRPPGPWENAPPPREENLKRRITITIHPLHYQVIRAAAEWAEAEVPRFIIGSMWRFIANRQRAEPRDRKVGTIEVPEKYRG